MAQRDDILEAIGADLFEQGNLPAEFESMRLDFQNMDILVTQLKDRYRAMQEERDKVRLEEQDQSSRYAKIEKYWDGELSIPMRDQEEARLRLHCIRDSDTTEGDPNSLKKHFETAGQLVSRLQSEKRKALDEISEIIRPLQVRLQKLESGMNQVRQEAEHLSQNRQKKFRRLAYHFYKNKLESEQFGARFALLDHIRTELGDNRKPPHPENMVFERKEEGGISWNGLMWLGLIIIFVGFHFRAQFFQQADVLASVTRAMHRDKEAEMTMFADLNIIDRKKLDADFPDLATLPAGTELFSETRRDEIQQIAISRKKDGDLLFCGLKLKASIVNFGQRLVRRGWYRQPTLMNFQAFTNKEFIWLVLGPREYLLIPAKEFGRFQNIEVKSTSNVFWLQEKIIPFDNNSPLLQGLDKLTVKMDKNNFAIDLSATNAIPEMEQRHELLDTLVRRAAVSERQYTIGPKRFSINGPNAHMQPEHFSGQRLVWFIKELMSDLTEYATESDLEFNTALPEQNGNFITVMAGARSNLHYAGSFSAGLSIADLAFLKKHGAILATDEKARSLRKWQLRGNVLESAGELVFGNNAARGLDAPFNPATMIVDPEEKLVAVLEKDPFFRRNPRIAFVTTEDLGVRWIVDLPKEVGKSLSGAWDQSGSTLVVGCSARRMRGKSSLAVLLYHLEDGEPRLFQLIDLPHGGVAPPNIPSLAWNTHDNQLLLFQTPNQNLIRYALDRTSDAIMEAMPFGVGLNETTLSARLALNRTEDKGILLGAGPGDTYLHLVSFGQEAMSLAERFDPGFKPAAILRIPMTDRFWVTGEERGVVAVVRISDNKLKLESQTPLTNFAPSLMTSDTWGDLLFLATRYRPAANN